MLSIILRIFIYGLICRFYLLGGFRHLDNNLPIEVLDILDELLENCRF